jgi:hypothetical protein
MLLELRDRKQLKDRYSKTTKVHELKYSGHRERYEEQTKHDELVRDFLNLCAAQSRWLSWDENERRFILTALVTASTRSPTLAFRDRFHAAFWEGYKQSAYNNKDTKTNLIMRILIALFGWQPGSSGTPETPPPVTPGGPPDLVCRDIQYVQEYLSLLNLLREMSFPLNNIPGAAIRDCAKDKPAAMDVDELLQRYVGEDRNQYDRDYKVRMT